VFKAPPFTAAGEPISLQSENSCNQSNVYTLLNEEREETDPFLSSTNTNDYFSVALTETH